jgi:hypothetical protein
MKKRVLSVVGGILLYSAATLAHHSFSVEFDRGKRIELKGKVTDVKWLNPHIQFNMSVKDDVGKVTNWEFELGSANALRRAGWTQRVQVGDELLVSGFRAKDSSNRVNAQWITLPNGKRMSGMSSINDPALR